MVKNLKWFGLVVVLSLAIYYCPSVVSVRDNHPWYECTATPTITNIVDELLDNNPYEDEVLIRFKRGVTKKRIQDVGQELGLKLEPLSELSRTYKATVPEGAIPLIHAHIFNHGYDREIFIVEENVTYRTLGTNKPNDPLYPFQWNLEQIRASEAWSYATGKGVVVAVLDTGIMLESDKERNLTPVRDLQGTNWVKGYDFVDDSDFSWDGHGHGTHVAGTIAQTTDNEYGVAGIAYDATLMNVRVLDSGGSGSSDMVADGIVFAADNGAHIINMSLGSLHRSFIIEEAVEYAVNKGVVIVAAAGNSGRREPSYPASYDGVISVAATQYDTDTTFYSQRGRTVDIAAPGGNTKVDQNGDGRPDGIVQETVLDSDPTQHDFLDFMGTSMASPHVAAVSAMIVQWGITRPARVEHFLKGTADTRNLKKDAVVIESTDVPTYTENEFLDRYGSGIVQADQAVKSVIWNTGKWRFIFALILSIGLIFLVKREEFLNAEIKAVTLFVCSSIVWASGLFVLPFIFPFLYIDTLGFVIQLLSTPLPMWSWVIFGKTTPFILLSLIPILTVLLLHRHPSLKYHACAFSVGVAAFALNEAVFLNMYVLGLPTYDLIHRLYFLTVALSCFFLPYLSLKRV